MSNLACTTCTLDSTFTPGTISFTSTVANNVSSVTITPTTTDSNATVTVNGTTVTSGTPSNPINLTVGTNTITVLVTAQDTSTTTYTLQIRRRSAPASGPDSSDVVAPVREATPTAGPTSPTTQPLLVTPIDDADMSLPPANPQVAIAPAGYFRVTSAAVAEAAPIRQMRKPGTPRLGPAPRTTSAPNAPIRLKVPKMAPEQTYTVLIRRPGTKYVTVGQVEPWQDGTLALPVISFKKRGLYILAVTDEAKAARYIKVRVS